jgi:vacuolar-type H+-ATPase subunit H
MSDFDTTSEIPDGPTKRWTPAARFTDLSERIARTLSALDRSTRGTPQWDEEADNGESVLPPKSESSTLFPSARNGYDRASVDAHVAELQRELAELRDRSPERIVAEEIDRIGKQTSEIIRLAYEKADEITRAAQANAQRTVDEAARKARELSEEAERHLHELDAETDTVWRDRTRLVEDVRSLATALFALAEDAADRFPAEGAHDDEETLDVASVGGPLDVPSGQPIMVEDLRQPSHGAFAE